MPLDYTLFFCSLNLHKGRIQVESDLKTGTTFLVTLPAAFRKTEPEQLHTSQQ